MRVLHIVPHMRNSGNGIVNAAVDLAFYQRRAGHAVAVASDSGGFVTLLQDCDISWFYLPQRRSPKSLSMLPFHYRRIVHDFRPDIVHAHNIAALLTGKFLRFRSGYKLVASAHRAFDSNAHTLALADRIIAVSAADAESLETRGVPRSKMRTVLNGPLGTPRRPVADDVQDVVLHHPSITTVAGLYHRKGIDVLIAAFEGVAREVADAHLYIVGHGPDKNRFIEQARGTRCNDRIHFVGFEPAPQRYLSGTDVFVLASRQEPFGLVLIEARSAGCAIVASDVGGIPEALDCGRAGSLVPGGDSGALGDMLLDILRDPDRMAQMKRQAQTGLERFEAQRMTDETLRAYA